MGLVQTTLTIDNPKRPDLTPLSAPALADTGALHLRIPEHVALQPQFEELEKREATLADGSKRAVPTVGPVHLRVANRSGFTGAIVLGDEVLPGGIPMEDMDLVVIPSTRQVVPNPKNPHISASIAKSLGTD